MLRQRQPELFMRFYLERFIRITHSHRFHPFLSLILLITCFSQTSFSETATCYPVADHSGYCWISGKSGDPAEIRIGRRDTGGTYRAYLTFDTSSIPDGATITIPLELHVACSSPSNGLRTRVWDLSGDPTTMPPGDLYSDCAGGIDYYFGNNWECLNDTISYIATLDSDARNNLVFCKD
jgi:hypothetical protein